MSLNNGLHNQITRRRAGQTLIIAIMVMFVVALVAAVFIGLVARNLFRSQRLSNTEVVAQLAEAGVRYADKMLTSSEEGADWRPDPDSSYTSEPSDWQTTLAKYPDYKWTRTYYPTEEGWRGPTGGYTTFQTGQGRFLLKVSYNPNPKEPLSKYIKIESIGRFGVFDENDPTTWKPYGDVSLRREITAYKPIGVTDYLRFVTNKDNRNTEFALGAPGYNMKFGRRQVDSKFGARGAPIRVNGNLTWYGEPVDLCLRGVNDVNGQIAPIDSIEVTGDIRNSSSSVNIYRTDIVTGGLFTTTGVNNPSIGLPSDDVLFNSNGGFYRDGRAQLGDPRRNIKRLEPPLVDQPDISNTTTRYRLLTLNSGERIKSPVTDEWINLGQLGWGRGIYIGNLSDVQSDSETLVGGYTLRADWIKPNNPTSSYWKGPYYIPPGVIITLHPRDTDGDSIPDLTITRTDRDFENWCDAWGYPRPQWGHSVTMPYPNPNGGRTVTLPTDNNTSKTIDGNGVIYAEGNIRIRGMLPPNMQLTIVSGQNIYIEGSLLKYRDFQCTKDDNDNYRGADNSCGLALLAEQNICVNTTMFFAPQHSVGSGDIGSDAENGQPPYHLIVSNEPSSRPRIAFDFGPWESEYGSIPQDWMMLMRHSGQFGTSYINMWLNNGLTSSSYNGLLALNTTWPSWGHAAVNGVPAQLWGIGDARFNDAGWGIGSSFWGEAFQLMSGTVLNENVVTAIGEPNILQIALDQTTFTRNNYLLGGFAIQPFDIRIEAVLYAQEGSFFVIPGNWFNPDPSDTQARMAIRPRSGARKLFPFFGQPLDIRIIVDGAVSENVTASIGDVEEWMSKWGKIPDQYGSSDRVTAHPGEGLTLLYDDHAGWPVYSDSTGAVLPIRTDRFGRALPITPRLPVSGSLLYFGDVM